MLNSHNAPFSKYSWLGIHDKNSDFKYYQLIEVVNSKKYLKMLSDLSMKAMMQN